MLSQDELTIIFLSLKVAAASVVFALPLAIGVALILARVQFVGKTLFDAVIQLPLVLPPVVIGYFLLIGFGRMGPLGAFFEQVFGISFAFRWTGAALAAATLRLSRTTVSSSAESMGELSCIQSRSRYAMKFQCKSKPGMPD